VPEKLALVTLLTAASLSHLKSPFAAVPQASSPRASASFGRYALVVLAAARLLSMTLKARPPPSNGVDLA